MQSNATVVPFGEPPRTEAEPSGYLETLALVERLHRLLIDVVKDEFERLDKFNINAVQALLLFNIGSRVVSAGELRNRGYYQGSNVSYNLKKLVDLGYLDHRRCDADRRAVRIRLTDAGNEVHQCLAKLFARHMGELRATDELSAAGIEDLNGRMRSLERYWSNEIRYIY